MKRFWHIILWLSLLLATPVLANDNDLTVIGAYARGLLFDTAIGRSRHIIEAIPGDVLVVRAVREARA